MSQARRPFTLENLWFHNKDHDWETEGTRFKSCLEAEGIFPAVLRPPVNWELVAWHEGNMDAANGISVFDHLVVGLIYSPPTV